MNDTDRLKSIASGDRLRVAINTGNRALVQMEGNKLYGVSPALARRLADELGLPMEPVIYNGAGPAFADAEHDVWEVAFLAINEKRAEKVAFTRPYIVIEATFAVRAGSEFTSLDQVDRQGVSVLTSVGSAYDTYLQANLQRAALERFGTPSESFEAFQAGRCDAVAGIRESLTAHLGKDDAVRILPGALTSVRQTMVLPGRDNPAIEALDHFVAEAIADGFVDRHTAAD
ncbi:MAG: transporter substrate-binding domain-containing protein [Pseudomonadota bacterium]